MTNKPAQPVNLYDFFDDETVAATVVSQSVNLARARHSDFDDVVGAHQFTAEQDAEGLSGRHDPGEYAYQTALAAQNYETPLDDILEGRVERNEPTLAESLLEDIGPGAES